jgi:hypothetical protein
MSRAPGTSLSIVTPTPGSGPSTSLAREHPTDPAPAADAFSQPLQTGIEHLGPGANHALVAEHLRYEFAAEIEKARREEDDDLLRQSGGRHLKD